MAVFDKTESLYIQYFYECSCTDEYTYVYNHM